ncbi:hypothetical protein ACTXT7_003692 [Hymenolepis weldensis]
MPLPKVDEWLDWCKKYNITFDSVAENIYRHWVWLKNYEMIQQHNARTDSTYKMGLNQFSYMEHWEFVEMNLRRRGVIKDYNEPDTPESSLTLPDIAATTAGNCLLNNFDWRDKFPSITARDQSSCGACWAFASAAVLEWHWAIHKEQNLSVSPQHLVDCVRASHGCSGGLIEHALYYAQNQGVASEQDYPYKSRVTQCLENSTRAAVKIKGYTSLLGMDENALACAVQRIGPIAIAFDFSGAALQHYDDVMLTVTLSDLVKNKYNKQISKQEPGWPQQTYDVDSVGEITDTDISSHSSPTPLPPPPPPNMTLRSGIYDGTDCSTELLNHAMVLVGFGTDSKGNQYWIAQNSFSQNWGENGFFRIKFGVNLCGLNSDPIKDNEKEDNCGNPSIKLHLKPYKDELPILPLTLPRSSKCAVSYFVMPTFRK